LNGGFMQKIMRLFFILFCFSQFALLSALSDDYLLPKNHSIQKTLSSLFKDPGMFDSTDHWRASGFQVLNRAHRGLMVARHPSMPNYLFKKFQNHISNSEQTDNYLRRITGARKLAQFIHRNQIKNILVPRKWLYQLPKKFGNEGKSYILIVDEIDICGGERDPGGEIAHRYATIEYDILRELCLVVYHFRGLDSILLNMPFTYHDKIAFIDTERWKRKREGYLKSVMPYLTEEKKQYALAIFNDLEAKDK
jgi:hypothetical protein